MTSSTSGRMALDDNVGGASPAVAKRASSVFGLDHNGGKYFRFCF